MTVAPHGGVGARLALLRTLAAHGTSLRSTFGRSLVASKDLAGLRIRVGGEDADRTGVADDHQSATPWTPSRRTAWGS